jgi:hypothetical protein
MISLLYIYWVTKLEIEAVADRRITTPMHTDRQKLIGYDIKAICGG